MTEITVLRKSRVQSIWILSGLITSGNVELSMVLNFKPKAYCTVWRWVTGEGIFAANHWQNKLTNRASVISQHEPDQLPLFLTGWLFTSLLMLNDKLHKQPAHSEYCHMFYLIYFLANLEHLNECSLICLWADHLSIKARLEYMWILPVNKKGLLTFGQLTEFSSCYLFGRYSIFTNPQYKNHF